MVNIMGKTFSTKQLAELIKVNAETIRRGLCVNGHYMLMRPVKLPNGRLLWPAEPVEAILKGEVA